MPPLERTIAFDLKVTVTSCSDILIPVLFLFIIQSVRLVVVKISPLANS